MVIILIDTSKSYFSFLRKMIKVVYTIFAIFNKNINLYQRKKNLLIRKSAI